MVAAVSIGGGRGQSATLSALLGVADDISAIVTVFDSGGSSGALQREFGYLPFGDVRRCLVALAGEDAQTQKWASIMNHRFPLDSSVQGHTVGNILLTSLAERCGNAPDAIEMLSSMLQLRGRVLPVAFSQAELTALLADGTMIRGEANIDRRATAAPSIRDIALSRDADANPEAIARIRQADIVALGPGDLYTSVIPNLLTRGVSKALQETKAKVCYICNIMTKYGETDDYKASDFAAAILRYMGRTKLDYLIVNAQSAIPPASARKYKLENAAPVEVDAPALKARASEILIRDVVHVREQGGVRHSVSKLRAALTEVVASVNAS